MLSELCVRRPVFATMLVMSLVVLGIFSFRDLGVDLFPRADPATVNVTLVAARARAPTRCRRRSSSRWSRRSAASPASTRSRRASARARATSPSGSCSSAISNEAVNDVREKVAGAIKSVPPELLPPVITKVDPDADPVMSLMVSSGLDEPADAHRARRQADVAVDPDGQRRRSGDDRRQPRARDPHRRRHREAEFVRAVDDAGARRRGRGERRDSRRRRRTGQGSAAAADDGPHRRDRGVQQHRRRDEERHADSRVGSRLRRRQLRAAHLVGVVRRQAGGAARHPARDGREHRRGHRRRPRAAADDRADAAQVGAR